MYSHFNKLQWFLFVYILIYLSGEMQCVEREDELFSWMVHVSQS